MFHSDISKYVVYQSFSAGYGIGMCLTSLHYKHSLYIMDRFDLMVYLQCISEYKVSSFIFALWPKTASYFSYIKYFLLHFKYNINCASTLDCIRAYAGLIEKHSKRAQITGCTLITITRVMMISKMADIKKQA